MPRLVYRTTFGLLSILIASCGEDTPTSPYADIGTEGFGVSGLLFNNNLVMYDRAQSEREQGGLEQLYLESPPGNGKTHLCRAAAAEAQRNLDERVLYTSAEAFTTAFTTALASKQIARFKQRFRLDPRLLVIDDIHFFAGKKQTQLELFHTVRHLLDTGRRVLLTGDSLPKDLRGFEDCLRAQIQSGFVAELEAPDASVRRGILSSRSSRSVRSEILRRCMKIPSPFRVKQVSSVTSDSKTNRPSASVVTASDANGGDDAEPKKWFARSGRTWTPARGSPARDTIRPATTRADGSGGIASSASEVPAASVQPRPSCVVTGSKVWTR